MTRAESQEWLERKWLERKWRTASGEGREWKIENDYVQSQE